jgi:hypothetical protein
LTLRSEGERAAIDRKAAHREARRKSASDFTQCAARLVSAGVQRDQNAASFAQRAARLIIAGTLCDRAVDSFDRMMDSFN